MIFPKIDELVRFCLFWVFAKIDEIVVYEIVKYACIIFWKIFITDPPPSRGPLPLL